MSVLEQLPMSHIKTLLVFFSLSKTNGNLLLLAAAASNSLQYRPGIITHTQASDLPVLWRRWVARTKTLWHHRDLVRGSRAINTPPLSLGQTGNKIWNVMNPTFSQVIYSGVVVPPPAPFVPSLSSLHILPNRQFYLVLCVLD